METSSIPNSMDTVRISHHYVKGVYTWPGGEKYEGEWVEGQMDGEGTKHYTGGERYIGHWKSGKRDGKGKII